MNLYPSVYVFKTTGNKSRDSYLTRPYHWAQTTVRKMLENREYVGDAINFKIYSKSNKLKKRLKNDPENILIFKDTHESIIDRKTFELVQKHFAGRKRPDKQGEIDKYAGYLFCGGCGKRLYPHRGKTIKPENNAFQCEGYQTRNTDCTAQSESSNSICPRTAGRILCDGYTECGYEQKQAELWEKPAFITEHIREIDMRERCIQEFMDKAKSYMDMPKLIPELLRVFIRRIEVYEKPEKYSRTCGNSIVIHYAFQLPEQNGTPAIEKVMLLILKTT